MTRHTKWPSILPRDILQEHPFACFHANLFLLQEKILLEQHRLPLVLQIPVLHCHLVQTQSKHHQIDHVLRFVFYVFLVPALFSVSSHGRQLSVFPVLHPNQIYLLILKPQHLNAVRLIRKESFDVFLHY